MTRELALWAAQKAFFARLAGADDLWSGVYQDIASEGASYPYLVIFWQGGGERNAIKAQDAEFVIIVKAVANSLSTASAAMARASELLNDKGEQESPDDYVNGGDDWIILSITQEETFYMPEEFAGSRTIYHVGARFRAIMEAR